MNNSTSIRRIIVASILGAFLLTAVSVAYAEPTHRGSCSVAKTEKKGSKSKKVPAVVETTYTGSAADVLTVPRNGHVEFHPEFAQTHRATVLPEIVEVSMLPQQDRSPVKFNGVVHGSNHKNQYVVVAGETVEDSNARYAEND